MTLIKMAMSEYFIVTYPAESTDPNYVGLDASDVQVTNLDNELLSGGGSMEWSSEDTPTFIDDQSTIFSVIDVPIQDDFQISKMTVNLDNQATSDQATCK